MNLRNEPIADELSLERHDADTGETLYLVKVTKSGSVSKCKKGSSININAFVDTIPEDPREGDLFYLSEERIENWRYVARKDYLKNYAEENKANLNEYHKEYRQEHKERNSEYGKVYYQEHKNEKHQYYLDHREERKEKTRQYYLDNKEAYKERAKNNKEQISETNKKYYEKNKEKKKASYQANKEAKKAYQKEYYNKKKKERENNLATQMSQSSEDSDSLPQTKKQKLSENSTSKIFSVLSSENINVNVSTPEINHIDSETTKPKKDQFELFKFLTNAKAPSGKIWIQELAARTDITLASKKN